MLVYVMTWRNICALNLSCLVWQITNLFSNFLSFVPIVYISKERLLNLTALENLNCGTSLRDGRKNSPFISTQARLLCDEGKRLL